MAGNIEPLNDTGDSVMEQAYKVMNATCTEASPLFGDMYYTKINGAEKNVKLPSVNNLRRIYIAE